ncbi:MAG: gluconate 2-dehydrogenase subunit 3 family protein [Pseudomonadota bacterium]
MTHRFSRRAVLMQIGLGSAAATLAPARHAFAQLDSRPWAFLTDDEARWLAAICDVFIPEDDYPSASQAGVVDYIDMQMATGYGQGEGLYLKGPFPEGTPQQGYQLPYTPSQLVREGLAGLRDRAEADITTLSAGDREAFVQAMSEETGTYGDVPAGTFFNEVLSLTNEGYFADPIYLGNHNYAGWEMVGFPGAHAYFLERVDEHNLPVDQPPMGIAHNSGQSTLPRPIGQEG